MRHGPLASQVVLLTGVSGSGKTTVGRLLAEEVGWFFFDADEFHSAVNLDKLARGVPLSDVDRAPWLERRRLAIRGWIEEDQATVLACSALKAGFRRRLAEGLEDRVRWVYLRGSFELIDHRLAQRKGHFMHKDLLANQFETLEEPGEALIVDIDDSPARIVARIRSGLGL